MLNKKKKSNQIKPTELSNVRFKKEVYGIPHKCESVEAATRKKRPIFAGALVRQHDG